MQIPLTLKFSNAALHNTVVEKLVVLYDNYNVSGRPINLTAMKIWRPR